MGFRQVNALEIQLFDLSASTFGADAHQELATQAYHHAAGDRQAYWSAVIIFARTARL